MDRLGAPAYLALARRGVTIRDSGPVTQEARRVKTPQERSLLDLNGAMVMEMLAAFESAIAPGVSERELLAVLADEMIRRGGEYLATNTVCSGPNTNPWRAEATDRRLEPGDLVYVDTDTVGIEGMFFCVSRTFPVGEAPPSAKQRDAYRASYEWLRAMEALIRPGVTCGELAATAPPIPERYLAQRYECMVHGIGLEEENPSVCHPQDRQSNADTVIEEDMALVVELYAGETGGATASSSATSSWSHRMAPACCARIRSRRRCSPERGDMEVCLMIEGQEGVTWEQWLALARACETLGFDGLFRSDHYLSFDRPRERGTLDAWATLAALAAVTERIRLGTMVSPATFRHPSVLAKSVMTADHVSGGRVELGMGAGWFEREHQAFGFPFPAAGERFDVLAEQVEIVHRLWERDEERGDVRGRALPARRGPGAAEGRAGPASAADPRRGRPGLARRRLAARWADEYDVRLRRPGRGARGSRSPGGGVRGDRPRPGFVAALPDDRRRGRCRSPGAGAARGGGHGARG